MTTSEENIFYAMTRRTSSMKIVQKSKPYQVHATATKKILKIFKADLAERSVPQLIDNERVVLSYTLDHDANSPEQINSLKITLKEIASCQESFSLLTNNPEMYKQSAEKMFSPKDWKDGLPLDGARKFLKSHYARLDNYLKASVDQNEKLLLVERKSSLKVLESCYIELQQKALGITPPSKNKGISR